MTIKPWRYVDGTRGMRRRMTQMIRTEMMQMEAVGREPLSFIVIFVSSEGIYLIYSKFNIQ